MTEWAKALKLPWTAAENGTRRPATGAHTITRAAVIVFFFWIFEEAVLYLLTTYVTGFVVWLCYIPFMGNDPPQFSGTW